MLPRASHPAAILITDARVYTADPARPWADAILSVGERIAYVGSTERARVEAQALPFVEEVAVPGGLVMPGFNDSHIHTDWGADSLGMLDLTGIYTLAELQQHLRAYAAQHPDVPWIEATSLGYEALGDSTQPRLLIDAAIPDRPVYIRAFDWHSAWVNTAALHQCGILMGAAIPLPNQVVVDDDGVATGVLKERLATTLVEQRIPARTSAQRDALLRQAIAHLHSLGITSVQNMHGDPGIVEWYERLRGEGGLAIRTMHYMRVREETPLALLNDIAVLSQRYTSPWNRVPGIKVFIDGVVESKTAMMLDPYLDVHAPNQRGVPDIDLEVYRAIVQRADALGMQVSTHAIGDWGVRETLNAYQFAQESNGGSRQRRHRVEHIEVLHRADLARFAALGVVASMQPLHCVPTTDPNTTLYARLLGEERAGRAFVWRSLFESGAHMSFGSDWPIVTPDVRQGLHAAINRRTIEGLPAEGYQPHEQVTLAQALDAYTRGAAYAEFQEQEKGMLRPGLLADITVLRHNPFHSSAPSILTNPIALTVVGGRIVYRAGQ